FFFFFFFFFFFIRFTSSVGTNVLGNKCFMFKGKKSDIKGNWSYARSWCKDQGGELAVIDDQYENDFVSSYLKDLELPTWIGLSDLLVENQYAWSDGVSAVLYTNWNDKEPNNAGGDEGCVSMHASRFFHGTWNDTKSVMLQKKKLHLQSKA
uniref:C-type lectin domain-containing protein n=1 Tax=Lates calcarifer TaxID=8187 RepID=A0A4W6CB70_LATCA